LVSEAFYLADPDGNGLELYRDRPRHEWKWTNGSLQMANAPIDLDDFFSEAGENPVWESMPTGTKIGHMHLRVRNIDESLKFYNGVLGFYLMATMPSAAFVSAGGYHHHLGMNIWHSRGANPPPANSVGLEEYSIVLPDADELALVVTRIDDAHLTYANAGDDVIVADPSGNKVRLTSAT
jgi:catechol 2,3-dioxygenase